MNIQTFRPLLVLLIAAFVALSYSSNNNFAQEITFGPLDWNITDPKSIFTPTSNPVPEDYCANPRFPIVPAIGPIQMGIMRELFPSNVSAPTNSWQRQIWGFKFDDFANWNGMYAYPYVVSPKTGGISIMYPGAPVVAKDGSNQNSRTSFQLANPPKPANMTNATYPAIVLSEAFDFGITIGDATPRLTEITKASATLEYQNEAGKTVAHYYIVKGSPYVTIECKNCSIGFGSQVQGGVPPIVNVNGKGVGSNITGSTFKMQIAQGPMHPQAQWWHAYFEKQVTFVLPVPPVNAYILQNYTGVIQIACGETDDVMGQWLDKYHGVYATGLNISYSINHNTSVSNMTYQWRKASFSKWNSTVLAMLALPHHTDVYVGAKPQTTKFWTVKGNMSAVLGDAWTLQYKLTNVGFGDKLPLNKNTVKTIYNQLVLDYKLYMGSCPGDNATQGYPGHNNMELYSYVRDLAKYTDLAIAAENLGEIKIATDLIKQIVICLKPFFEKPKSDPQPCETPMTDELTCVKNEVALWYDTKWGGIVTGWYSRFAFEYQPGGQNPQGYYPFNNYGNSFYNDHHFQYGYLVRVFAHVLNFHRNGTYDIGLSKTDVVAYEKLALALARDYANPNEKDPFFTVARHKDFFDGHSWAEGYDYSGRAIMWINQQSGGEAVNSYYAIYLLGLALNDSNVRDWGRILLATEMQSVDRYQHLSSRTPERASEPTPLINERLKCMSMLVGNGLTGATYFGPSSIFQCGITLLPVTPIIYEWLNPTWAGEAFNWMQAQIVKYGKCVYPAEVALNQTANPCPGTFGAGWWGNQYECCPLTDGAGNEYPNQQWKAYPDWFPYMYLIQAVNNTAKAWENLNPANPITQPSASLPFPYMNDEGLVVGYPPGMTRTQALFIVAMNNQTNHNSTVALNRFTFN